MKQRFIKSVLMVALCMAFGTTAAQTIIVNNSNGSKDAPVKPNIDMTKYDKRILKNGNEVYTPKQNNSAKKLNAGEAEMVNVTFKLSYDQRTMFPDPIITVTGENFSGDLWMDYDWENDDYFLTYLLPAGTYDFLSAAYPDDNGIAYNVKEMVEVINDTTITFNFAESNIKYNYKTYKPNGEEATLNEYPSDENPELIPGNTTYFVDNISLILKGSGNVGTYSSIAYGKQYGKNPFETVLLNSLSNRYKLVSERLFEDENGLYIIKYETTDINETLLQNDPENFVLYEENFSSIGDDYNGLYQGLSTIEMIDNVDNGGLFCDVTHSISKPVVKIYVDPNRKDGTEPNKFDILVQPKFQDNISKTVLYPWYDYDDEDNPIEYVDTVQLYRTIIGLPVLINNDGSMEYVNTGHDASGNYAFHIPEGGGDLIEYPGHPQFSFTNQQKALSYGSNCPITSVMVKNTEGVDIEGKYSYIEPAFIGRYGEVVSGFFTTVIKYNTTTINENCLTLPEDMYNFATQGNPDGVITAHFENTNAVVDGMQGRNVTDVYYDQRQADWTAPTLQMLTFKDHQGRITDRFATGDEGILEFAGGDFNFTIEGRKTWFDCKEQTVEVSYSPYNADQWLALDVEEVPGEFYMPGFGYFYRGSLEDVTNPSATGWYDLRIKLTDLSGNWQEQVISPAFRIGNSTPTGIEVVTSNDATEVARYTIDGRAISAPQAGVNIVKMSDGTVKKVLVK